MAGDDRCALHRRLQAVEEACRRGDLAAFRAALGDPPDFPNGILPEAFMALGGRPLCIALIHGPPEFVRGLLALGADPNAPADDGFPSLHAAIDAPRPDRHDLLRLLLAHGADPNAQRGINDGTPLHHAVWRRDLEAVRVLLAHGADPGLRTRIDDCTTPRDDAVAMGFTEAAALLS